MVVADHFDLGPELAHVLHQVVGEAVVVVDDEDSHELNATEPQRGGLPPGRPPNGIGPQAIPLHGHSGWATASSIAASTAAGFASDSLELVVGLGVGDGAAAGLDVGDAVLDDHGADVDAGVELAV